MKTMRLNVATSLVLVALLCPVALADGEQGSGGFAAADSCVKVERTLDGEQGSGGYTDGEQGSGGLQEGEQGSGGLNATPCEEPSYTDSFISSVYSYFEEMF